MVAYAIPAPTGVTGIGINGGEVRAYSAIVDFSTQSNASGDTFDVINIPSGAIVLGGSMEILTAGAGSGTLALTAGGTSIVAAVVQTGVGAKTTVAVANTLKIAATTLRLTVATAAVDSKVRVTVLLATDGGSLLDADGDDVQTITLS